MKSVLTLAFLMLTAACVNTQGATSPGANTPNPSIVLPPVTQPRPGLTSPVPGGEESSALDASAYSLEEMEDRARVVKGTVGELGWQGGVSFDLASQRFRVDIDELPTLFGTNGSDLAEMLAAALNDPANPNRIDIAAYQIRVIVHIGERSIRPCQECAIR